jgi:peptidoglycan/xylan/chitin deacetylase (PgdA/CDA1 family)
MPGFQWPNGRRCAVSFTFDMDGETVPFTVDREHAPRRLALMSEFAYGPLVAMPHILDLLELYEIRGSFFIPGFTAELHPDVVREIVRRGHDVGHHGYMHERPDGLDDDAEERVLLRGIQALESITGVRPAAYRSPAWELKPSSPELLLRHGFRFDSSLMGHDIPYWVQTRQGRLLELPVNWKHDDWPQLGFVSVPAVGTGISAPSKALEVFTEEFEGLYARGGLFNMTMHPFLIGRPSGLRLLERLIRFVRGFPRVWWAPLSEIAAYCASPETDGMLPVQSAEIPEARWLT